MRERYLLYFKKNIFNGKYFVRNLQIGIGALLLFALLIGTIVLACTDNQEREVLTADADVETALFGTDVDSQTEKKEQKNTEEVSVITKSQSTTEKNVVDALYKSEATTQETVVEPKEEKKSSFDDRCIAKVDESLNVRQEPDSDSTFVGLMNTGAIAKVLGTEGEWTKIKSGDVEGYVLSEFVLTGEEAESFSKSYVCRVGQVLQDGVNVREDKSTQAEILQVLEKDTTISVVEVPSEEVKEEQGTDEIVVNAMSDTQSNETPDEIEWITVSLESGQIGYVSAEFLKIDELYELAVSAEELERIAQAEAEEAARKAAEEEAARMELASNDSSSSSNGTSSNSSSNDNSYTGQTTTPVTASESGECLGTFTITAYCGCNECSKGNNLTATGTVPAEGRTIAADTSVLPYGTQVVIDGIVYTVEDCGSGVCGNHIDIFFSTHERALAYGRRSVKVYKY